MDDLDYIDPLTGRVTPVWLQVAVTDLLHKIRHKDIWEIVDFCIKIWGQRNPEDYKAYFKEMKKYKANRLNEYASSKSKVHRELVSLPEDVNYLLDKLAAHRIADYGAQKFWREFARRYPGFSPAKRV